MWDYTPRELYAFELLGQLRRNVEEAGRLTERVMATQDLKAIKTRLRDLTRYE